MQHEKLTKGIYFGFVGNVLFIAFGIICIFYYYTYEGGIFSKIVEIAAYMAEFMGFGLLLYSDWLLSTSIRSRKALKVLFTFYIILEALMMFLELNAYRFEAYEPYSLPLAIVHSVVSGAVCFAFLQLDPENLKWEIVIGACFTLILTGMVGNLMGIRVYFSIAANAVGFAVLFGALRSLREREQIEIDCYGDRANEAVFSSSTLFAEEKDEQGNIEEDIEEAETGTEETGSAEAEIEE